MEDVDGEGSVEGVHPIYKNYLYFLISFAVNLKLLICPLPHAYSLPTISILHQNGTFVIIDEPMLTYHNYPKSGFLSV